MAMSRMNPGTAPIYVQVISSPDEDLRAEIDRMNRALAKSLRAPLPYRGIFKDGETYERGEFVTWGGCLWHCEHASKQRPKDAPECWTLAVKKGRDGKDGWRTPRTEGDD